MAQAYWKHYDYLCEECNKLGVDHSGLDKYHDDFIMNYNHNTLLKYERYLTWFIRSLLEVSDENISECSFGFDPTHLLIGAVKLRNTIYREHKEMLLRGDNNTISE